MKFKEVIVILVHVILIATLIGALFGWSNEKTGKINDLIISVGISFALSALVGELIEKFTGDFFKNIYLSFPIWKFRINIPLFFLLTIVIKNAIF